MKKLVLMVVAACVCATVPVQASKSGKALGIGLGVLGAGMALNAMSKGGRTERVVEREVISPRPVEVRYVEKGRKSLRCADAREAVRVADRAADDARRVEQALVDTERDFNKIIRDVDVNVSSVKNDVRDLNRTVADATNDVNAQSRRIADLERENRDLKDSIARLEKRVSAIAA